MVEKPPPKHKQQPIRSGPRTRRNAPCPCGSGKKFKRCHHPNRREA